MEYTDESKFNLFGFVGWKGVSRKKNGEMEPRNLVCTVKYGGGSGRYGFCWCRQVMFIHSKMDQFQYIDILEENVQSGADKIGLDNDFAFQQGNDPKHRALNTTF